MNIIHSSYKEVIQYICLGDGVKLALNSISISQSLLNYLCVLVFWPDSSVQLKVFNFQRERHTHPSVNQSRIKESAFHRGVGGFRRLALDPDIWICMRVEQGVLPTVVTRRHRLLLANSCISNEEEAEDRVEQRQHQQSEQQALQ